MCGGRHTTHVVAAYLYETLVCCILAVQLQVEDISDLVILDLAQCDSICPPSICPPSLAVTGLRMFPEQSNMYPGSHLAANNTHQVVKKRTTVYNMIPKTPGKALSAGMRFMHAYWTLWLSVFVCACQPDKVCLTSTPNEYITSPLLKAGRHCLQVSITSVWASGIQMHLAWVNKAYLVSKALAIAGIAQHRLQLRVTENCKKHVCILSPSEHRVSLTNSQPRT